MKSNGIYNLFLVLFLLLVSCKERKVEITVSNPTDKELGTRLIEINASEILHNLNSKSFYITDESGNEITSQLTYDGKILFPANVLPATDKKFIIYPDDSVRNYENRVFGDFYPKRRDDIAYENDLIGVRIYGPGTELAGEKSFGYDLFFKYPESGIVLPSLYAAQTDDALWAKVDSLRRIDSILASEFEDSFSYHIDHGKGMDCFAVGSTLGAGVAALVINDTVRYPWCYKEAVILDNGPLRFTIALDFIDDTNKKEKISEHRLITLDYGNHLNLTKVWYEGLSGQQQIVTGFPLRDEGEIIENTEDGILAYSSPVQNEKYGRALLGILTSTLPDSIYRKDNHILIAEKINPPDTFTYRWGYAWNQTDIQTMEKWNDYLKSNILNYKVEINH